MLSEFLGSDLSKISNELNKLMSLLPNGTTITAIDIERNIGISKDYNIFELRKIHREARYHKSQQDHYLFRPKPQDQSLSCNYFFVIQLFYANITIPRLNG